MGEFLRNWIAGSLSYSVPYALAALGLIVSERSGVLTLSAEGVMLVGALAGIAFCLGVGELPAVALLAAMLAATAMSALFALLVVTLRVDQVIGGLIMVFFCQGLTNLVGTVGNWTNRAVAGLGTLAFQQDLVVYLVVPLFFLVDAMLLRSAAGLKLRAVGENPQAADAAGIGVAPYRFAAILLGGALIGLAGAYLALMNTKIWVQNMSAGRGWIAIALVIFARWHPWRALAGALLFGGIESLVPRMAAAGFRLPQYFVLMTPYLATLGVMVWIARSKRGFLDVPGALGQPYVREERR